eukprot:scaffold139355_cov127-Phaeocystis_antarctica.AAC.1
MNPRRSPAHRCVNKSSTRRTVTVRPLCLSPSSTGDRSRALCELRVCDNCTPAIRLASRPSSKVRVLLPSPPRRGVRFGWLLLYCRFMKATLEDSGSTACTVRKGDMPA